MPKKRKVAKKTFVTKQSIGSETELELRKLSHKLRNTYRDKAFCSVIEGHAILAKTLSKIATDEQRIALVSSLIQSVVGDRFGHIKDKKPELYEAIQAVVTNYAPRIAVAVAKDKHAALAFAHLASNMVGRTADSISELANIAAQLKRNKELVEVVHSAKESGHWKTLTKSFKSTVKKKAKKVVSAK